MSLDLDRVLALIGRELGAAECRVLPQGAPIALDADLRELRVSLPDGRTVAAIFDAAPEDRDARLRRMKILLGTFDEALKHAPGDALPLRGSRPAARDALRDELQALCERAAALNALVLDANSPVVWGAAEPEGVAGEAALKSSPALPIVGPDPPAVARGEPVDASHVALVSRAALGSLRVILSHVPLRKRSRHVVRVGESPLLARSFAGIYFAAVLFDRAFDELRAERALTDSLPRIERLVLALPPLDPPPEQGAGVVALRRARRR
ncbi:MAG: hypothetical protein ACREJ3_03575 [Polyangiaceae bacterium]